jgi:hypothetical protein
MNKMRPIPDMITDLRALANSPEALISHVALLDAAANYIEATAEISRQHIRQLLDMRVRLEQVRPLMVVAVKELEEFYDMYRSNQHQYERDMELPRAIKSMLRWWEPGTAEPASISHWGIVE